MEETDIITCLEKEKKIIVRLKNIFHKCRYTNKSALQNCYREDICSLINF